MPVHHAILIKEALTQLPLNTIFVLIPFDPRPGDNLLDEFDETTKCLTSIPDFRDMVVIIITKFDICEPKFSLDAENDIRKIFAEEGLSRIMFSSINSSPEDLAN
jgi:hypothetical protein